MSTIDEILPLFQPITLEEMDAVKLMNRTDSKYILKSSQFPYILDLLKDTHKVLEINHSRIQRYETIYFDTPGHKCYHDHHNKRSNRFKIRSRRYADSGLTYLEIKIKNNKGRTRKERNKQHGGQHEITGKPAALLLKETGLHPGDISPVLWIKFSRITLVDCNMSSRVTFDTNLIVTSDHKSHSFPWFVIAEIKQEKSQGSVFQDIMRSERVPGFGFSKYCLGMVTLNKNIRYNNFKEKINFINKLNHDIS